MVPERALAGQIVAPSSPLMPNVWLVRSFICLIVCLFIRWCIWIALLMSDV